MEILVKNENLCAKLKILKSQNLKLDNQKRKNPGLLLEQFINVN